VPGPRPAPELARYDKIHAERPGVPAPATPPAPAARALGVLSAVLDHDGQQYSATQTRNQALADAEEAGLAAARAGAEAAAAERSGRHETVARHRVLAASYLALREAYRERESVFGGVMADRADWEAATRAQRHLSVAADAELRRRHPQQRFTPLRSAEPQAERRRSTRPVHTSITRATDII